VLVGIDLLPIPDRLEELDEETRFQLVTRSDSDEVGSEYGFGRIGDEIALASCCPDSSKYDVPIFETTLRDGGVLLSVKTLGIQRAG
jgi:sensor domain CHASE-containing protein